MIWFSQFLTVNQTDFPATHRFVNEDLSSSKTSNLHILVDTCLFFVFWVVLFCLFFLAKTKKNLCES